MRTGNVVVDGSGVAGSAAAIPAQQKNKKLSPNFFAALAMIFPPGAARGSRDIWYGRRERAGPKDDFGRRNSSAAGIAMAGAAAKRN